MDLEFVAIDPDTRDGNCPTVWIERDAGELVFQGWNMMSARSAADLPPRGQSLVRLPARMADAIRRACDIAEQSAGSSGHGAAGVEDFRGESIVVRVDLGTAEFVVRGWDAPADMIAACLETGAIPESESVVRLPLRTVDAVRRVCDIADGLFAGTA